MFVQGIGIAHPAHCYTKADCWQSFLNSTWLNKLDRRARMITDHVLNHDNGIEQRWLAVDSLDEVFDIDPVTLNKRFERHAPMLAIAAAQRALEDAGLAPEHIDAVVVSTCTGYLCPALSGYVMEALKLRADVEAYDLVGQGCAAALPNWRMGKALIDSGRAQHVLSVCVEVCSAAMYLDNDPGVLISACLFGDGAGAAILSAQPHAQRRRVEWKGAGSLTQPAEREALRFEHRDGLLRNILTRRVPGLAAESSYRLMQDVLASLDVPASDIRTWILHAGGRDVLLALQAKFKLADSDVVYSSKMLRQYGNLSSAFVYFVLKAALDDGAPAGMWWMASFGAGFSCHGALLEVA